MDTLNTHTHPTHNGHPHHTYTPNTRWTPSTHIQPNTRWTPSTHVHTQHTIDALNTLVSSTLTPTTHFWHVLHEGVWEYGGGPTCTVMVVLSVWPWWHALCFRTGHCENSNSQSYVRQALGWRCNCLRGGRGWPQAPGYHLWLMVIIIMKILVYKIAV